MAHTVPYGCFVPKKNTLGSWDSSRIIWNEFSRSFSQDVWGIKAHEAVSPDGVRSFVYPLEVTEVVHGEEAYTHGLSKGDIIVEMNSIKVTARKDLLQLPSDQKRSVSMIVQKILMTGGPCEMKIKRGSRCNVLCTECGSSDIEEVVERGDLVCRGCGVVHRSRVVFTGTNWENESTTHIEEEEMEGEEVTYQHIDLICAKLDLDTSVSTQARREVSLFKKTNRAGGMKMRYRPQEALAAACIIVVCKFKNIGRTEKEILAVCTCTKKTLATVLRGVNRSIVELSNRRIPPSTARDVIQRFCTNMKMPQLVAKTALHIVHEIDRRGICQSRLISSVAGAAIFMACVVCREDVNIEGLELAKAVSIASGAADATIKEVCKALYTYKDRILPQKYLGSDLSILLH
jgi:transcription initiation factor TFIIIB Brf1 subunit/transcription initiation factor TFIIB